MKRLLVIAMVLLLSVSFAFSQEIDTKKMDLGLRTGWPFGVSARFPMGEGKMLEANVGIGSSLLTVTGLYEFHKPLKIGELEGFSWFWGFGAHVGIANLNLGIDGIVGLEYDFEPLINFPLSVSTDWKPALNFLIAGGMFSNFGDASLTFRYHF
jgi:hypothetical protein